MRASTVGAFLAAGTALAALALLLWLRGAQGAEDPPVTFDRAVISVETLRGIYRFHVEVARTSAQRSQGLMHRTELAADAGMLFLFPKDRHVGMWMKDTLIPLDMIFISRKGRVVDIAQQTRPLSLEVIRPAQPVRAVLEVPAGTVKRLGLQANDRVEWRLVPRAADVQ